MTHLLHRYGIAFGLVGTLTLLACNSSDDDDSTTADAGSTGTAATTGTDTTSSASETTGGASSGTTGASTSTETTTGTEDSTEAGADTGSDDSTGSSGIETGSGSDEGVAEADIIDTATAAGNFTVLLGALEATSLTDALRGDGPLTVFAPTDDAFAAFEAENPGVLDALSTEELAAVLTHHVVSGAVAADDLVDGSLVETLNGTRVAVDLSDGASIGGADVTDPDVIASNGITHVIDRVMLPPSMDVVETAVAAGSFTTLAGALVDTGLDEVLQGEGPFTVFAPTDDAFAAFEAANPGVLASLSTEALTDVLLYHVVAGWAGPADLEDGMSLPTQLSGASLTVSLDNGVQIDDANVTAANIVTTNGVIHVIDAVLLPDTE